MTEFYSLVVLFVQGKITYNYILVSCKKTGGEHKWDQSSYSCLLFYVILKNSHFYVDFFSRTFDMDLLKQTENYPQASSHFVIL